jgi:hypothetical protein
MSPRPIAVRTVVTGTAVDPRGLHRHFAVGHKAEHGGLVVSRRPLPFPRRLGLTDILISVVAEGWKLVAGAFVYAEMGGGAGGCYLFKRSKKRHRKMNDPSKSSVE